MNKETCKKCKHCADELVIKSTRPPLFDYYCGHPITKRSEERVLGNLANKKGRRLPRSLVRPDWCQGKEYTGKDTNANDSN